MSDAAKLLELADRVERARGPDRELDLAIHALLFVDQDLVDVLLDAEGDFAEVDGGWGAIVVSRYTASLDAAMTLVPDVFRLVALTEAMRVAGTRTIWFAKLGHADRRGGLPATQSATPALALCAAALRARASQVQPS